MSRDELVEAVRKYVEREFPNYRCASILVDVGDAMPHELLLVMPSALRGGPQARQAEPTLA